MGGNDSSKQSTGGGDQEQIMTTACEPQLLSWLATAASTEPDFLQRLHDSTDTLLDKNELSKAKDKDPHGKARTVLWKCRDASRKDMLAILDLVKDYVDNQDKDKYEELRNIVDATKAQAAAKGKTWKAVANAAVAASRWQGMVQAHNERVQCHLPHIEQLRREVSTYKETVRGNSGGEEYVADYSPIMQHLEMAQQYGQMLREENAMLKKKLEEENRKVRKENAMLRQQLEVERKAKEETATRLATEEEMHEKTKSELIKTHEELTKAEQALAELKEAMNAQKEENNSRFESLEKRVDAMEGKEQEKE